MYCEKCGKEIKEQEICPLCGCLSGYVPKEKQGKPLNFDKVIYTVAAIIVFIIIVILLLATYKNPYLKNLQ
ncbi:MAG: hypothetical protein NC078_04400 [Ruminococcus sp.]|nr:hypothetical protein [Ruminococcus sp.]